MAQPANIANYVKPTIQQTEQQWNAFLTTPEGIRMNLDHSKVNQIFKNIRGDKKKIPIGVPHWMRPILESACEDMKYGEVSILQTQLNQRKRKHFALVALAAAATYKKVA
jgi:hemerythrin superfamily protein